MQIGNKCIPSKQTVAYNAIMNTNDLTIFVEVMRKRNFAQIARERGINPASVTRSIAALEKELKVRLFQRTTRRVEPTEAAVAYFERVEPLLCGLANANLAAADLSERPNGILRFSCPVSFAELNITPLLPEFATRFPELDYELVYTDTVIDLIGERLDAAIRIGSLNDSSLIAHKLSPMVARVCAAPAYLKRNGRPENPEDLIHHKCLLLDLPGFSRNVWKFTDGQKRRQEITVGEFLRTSNAMAMKQCVLAGMGITLQGRWLIGKELRMGTLVDLFPEYETTAAVAEDPAAWLLYPSREYVPQKTRVFVDFLKEKFKDGAPWDN